MFADGARLLVPALRKYSERTVQRAFVLTLVTVFPIALYLVMGEPVALLKMAGAIEAAHIPVVTGLTLYLNHTRLPRTLRPSWPVMGMTAAAGLFFTAFAVYYLVQLAGCGGAS
jgi:hypothetical protein